MQTKHSKDGAIAQSHSSWQQLYLLAGHWKSDLRFYSDDLRFLYHLIDTYFIWITKKEYVDKVLTLKSNLHRLKTKSEALLQKVTEHQNQLGQCVENANGCNEGIIRKGHADVEDDMAAFVKSFRINRKEVMKLSGYIIDSEELANILET